MTDPFTCLRNSSIAVALWNILYSLIQIGIFGWQIKYCRDRQWELGNRNSEIPWNPVGLPQSLHPGLYNVYSETPEKRRLSALFALSITTEIVACAHLCSSVILLLGAVKAYSNCIWPWLISVCVIICTSTAYSVLWWSGDVFGEQLAMSVAEFIMSLAINGICGIVVAFYFARIRGDLTSINPKETDRSRPQQTKLLPHGVASWKEEWGEKPPKELEKRIMKKTRRFQSSDMQKQSKRRTRNKFYRLSLSPEVLMLGQPRQFERRSADHIPFKDHMTGNKEQPKKAICRGRTTENSRSPSGRYNWLYLSQERLNAHNARFGKSLVNL